MAEVIESLTRWLIDCLLCRISLAKLSTSAVKIDSQQRVYVMNYRPQNTCRNCLFKYTIWWNI